MKLTNEFIQLPLLFDVEQLKKEVAKFTQADWKPHHEGFNGNFSIPLISVGGKNNNDFKGEMKETSYLQSSPYLRQVISSFGEVIGRSRLMGLSPGAEVPLHSDINYHWFRRVRIHVPIVTEPSVTFYCADKEINMQAGEAWIFDSWKYHRVCNASDVFRVHLVIDICGSSRFWALSEKGNCPGEAEKTPRSAFTNIPFETSTQPPIYTEKYNAPLVMSPGEMEGLAYELFDELDRSPNNSAEDAAEFRKIVRGFCQDWRVLWTQFGLTEAGWPHYHNCRNRAFESVRKFDTRLKLANGTQAPRMFLFCMIDPALNVEVKTDYLAAMNTDDSGNITL